MLLKGMQFDRGYLSPYFVTDAERMEVAVENPYILIYEKKISSMKDLLPLLEQIARTAKPLIIIAEDVDGEALATLVVNKLRGTVERCGCQGSWLWRSSQGDAAGYCHPDRRQGELRKTSASSWKACRRSRISARRSASRSTRTTRRIVDGGGADDDISGRVKEIRAQVDKTTSDYDREKLQERSLAKLVGGVAVIKVGAATETEMKEKKARVEDAMHATRAAVEEGIVPGWWCGAGLAAHRSWKS